MTSISPSLSPPHSRIGLPEGAPNPTAETLPTDRKGIMQYVRGCIPQIGSSTAAAIGKLPDQESLAAQLEDYKTFCEKSPPNSPFCDFVEFVGGVTDAAEPNHDQAEYIDWLSSALAVQAPFQVQSCSFANQTDFRRDLYNKHPEISDVAAFLKCPVIDASATDFLVLTSINPYTAKLAAEIIGEIVFRETKIIPFIFLTTCPVRTKNYICAKHFVS